MKRFYSSFAFGRHVSQYAMLTFQVIITPKSPSRLNHLITQSNSQSKHKYSYHNLTLENDLGNEHFVGRLC